MEGIDDDAVGKVGRDCDSHSRVGASDANVGVLRRCGYGDSLCLRRRDHQAAWQVCFDCYLFRGAPTRELAKHGELRENRVMWGQR